ncbi:universal stress protein [Pseudohalioglobus lutimaris]|uniref:Universal stress protein n=1 Tax=Pseudohalioglobus lutimaris TaxID=1737061 RepID=A0A2N5X4S3_9GAMM|nr:universal stress protein [Pseudohalioglobus lutimaris]PLW69484.1 universal stress protein [Pseudohalioglobus lutimaris]
MSQYKTVLVAIDLSDESGQVALRAQAIARAGGCELHVIHVIEPLSFAYGVDIPMDFSGLQDEIQSQATEQLQRFAEQNGIDADHQHIVLGRAEVEIHAMAEEVGADLIVLGSHGRHGLSLLMGSTANGVLHGAKCDVLAVRVGKQN